MGVVILGVVFFVIVIVYTIACFIDQHHGKNTVVLPFNEFYKYYRLNPDSWIVNYNALEKSTCPIKAKQHLYPNILCRIKFTSYWRYLLFVFDLKHNHKTTYISFLKEVQKDIDKCKEEAERWNEQGINMLEKILTK